VIEPGEIHATNSISVLCTIIVILYIPDTTIQCIDHLYGGYLKFPYAYDTEIQAVFSKVNNEYAAKLRGYESILHGCVYEFLGYLNRIDTMLLKNGI